MAIIILRAIDFGDCQLILSKQLTFEIPYYLELSGQLIWDTVYELELPAQVI